MALSARQLTWLRDEIGSKPADAALNERYGELQSVTAVAIAVLRARRAQLLASPLSVNVAGVAAVNNAENVKAIERRLTALAGMDDDPTDEEGESPDSGDGDVEAFQLTRSRGR